MLNDELYKETEICIITFGNSAVFTVLHIHTIDNFFKLF